MNVLQSAQKVKIYQIGRNLKLGPELARGGEGVIRRIIGSSDTIAKIYHKPSEEKTAKLRAMLRYPPKDPIDPKLKHISIAWPTALILNEYGICIGFAMPYIDPKENFPLLKVYNPRDRRELRVYSQAHQGKIGLNLNWGYLVRMAYNLAHIITELHRAGYVVGDLNESNILVTPTALVTLVDCDSIQVPKPRQEPELKHLRKPKKTYFRCPVGKPEYTPPELQGKDFSRIDRKQKHDTFSLAVLVFLMLMEGRHPFAGAWRGSDLPRTLAQNIQSGDFPYGAFSNLMPPRNGLPFDTMPRPIQELMMRCFTSKLRSRPSAATWLKTLEDAEELLVRCPRPGSQHVYSNHLDDCPWCERIHKGIPDPFPAVSGDVPDYPLATKRRFHSIPRPLLQKILISVFIFLTFLLYLSEIYIAYLLRSFANAFFHSGFVIILIVALGAVLLPIAVYLILVNKYLGGQ